MVRFDLVLRLGAPLFYSFVPKSNGKMRMCLDLRGLNDVTIKDKTALPNIPELFDMIQRNRYYSKLDLRTGFNQVRVADKDIEKTAFNTPWGHFEWPVMPFGLTNAPATFQALMQDILRERLYNGVIVFIDDILIYSHDEASFGISQIEKGKRILISGYHTPYCTNCLCNH